MAVSRSRSSTVCVPEDLYYLAPGFPAHSLTVAALKTILLKHHVSSSECKRKADYVVLFETKVLPKREKIIKKREDAAEAGMKMKQAAHHNRVVKDEEGSDNDASAGSSQSTDGEDSNDEEATGGLNLETLLKTASISEPSSGPSKSRQTSKQPTPSPLPVRKLPTLSQQLENFGGRITSLEHTVRLIREQDSLQAQLQAHSEQIEELKEAMNQLWVIVSGKKAGKKNKHRNGKGKERASNITFDTIDEEEEL